MNRMNLLAAALLFTLIPACSDDDTESNNSNDDAVVESARAAALTYADIVSATYDDSLTEALNLDGAVEALTQDPSATNLADARQAWLDSREPYLQSEVFRFYDGPIDRESDGPEGLINAWPLDEAYIDYVEGNDTSGVVNDTDVTIDAETLVNLNEAGGETNIATGYHAIEFLLWGQDLNATGPGERSFEDYADPTPNYERRALYLETTAELLVQHITWLNEQWAVDTEANYRAEFEASEPLVNLRRILTGMIVLSGFETGGERLQVALDSGDQEDEHSCFSDNTHRDMIQDVRGVQNAYLGRYKRIDGTMVEGASVKDVIALKDAELADALEAKIAESLALAEAMQTPFDQEIATANGEGRGRVQALVIALNEQEELLEQAFRTFEFDIPVTE